MPHRKEQSLHPSDSGMQRRAEKSILASLAGKLDVKLEPMRVSLSEGAQVDVDGVAADRSVFVEIFSHQGRLKGGQVLKVSNDAFKLASLGLRYPKARLILAFADPSAAAFADGEGWRAAALKSFGIEVHVIDLDESTQADLRAAQTRQVMVNPDANG